MRDPRSATGAIARSMRAVLLLAIFASVSASGLAQVVLPAGPDDIVVIGDELAAGYGLAPHEMYPAILLRDLKRENLNYQVRSASAPGDTAEVGARRVPVVLQVPRLKWVILALGRNDAARKVALDNTRASLSQTIEAFLEKGVGVLLCGLREAPGDDLAYSAGFSSLFPELARGFKIPFVTNLLAGIEGVPAMNLNDGKHPNKDGQRQIARNISDVLFPLLRGSQTNAAPQKAAPEKRDFPPGTVAPPMQF